MIILSTENKILIFAINHTFKLAKRFKRETYYYQFINSSFGEIFSFEVFELCFLINIIFGNFQLDFFIQSFLHLLKRTFLVRNINLEIFFQILNFKNCCQEFSRIICISCNILCWLGALANPKQKSKNHLLCSSFLKKIDFYVIF